jgi:hypothetical protein
MLGVLWNSFGPVLAIARTRLTFEIDPLGSPPGLAGLVLCRHVEDHCTQKTSDLMRRGSEAHVSPEGPSTD